MMSKAMSWLISLPLVWLACHVGLALANETMIWFERDLDRIGAAVERLSPRTMARTRMIHTAGGALYQGPVEAAVLSCADDKRSDEVLENCLLHVAHEFPDHPLAAQIRQLYGETAP